MTEKEVRDMARQISMEVWRKVRAYIRRQQRELHDLEDDDDD